MWTRPRNNNNAEGRAHRTRFGANKCALPGNHNLPSAASPHKITRHTLTLTQSIEFPQKCISLSLLYPIFCTQHFWLCLHVSLWSWYRLKKSTTTTNGWYNFVNTMSEPVAVVTKTSHIYDKNVDSWNIWHIPVSNSVEIIRCFLSSPLSSFLAEYNPMSL